jgi:hypothetical protein
VLNPKLQAFRKSRFTHKDFKAIDIFCVKAGLALAISEWFTSRNQLDDHAADQVRCRRRRSSFHR